MPEILVFEVTNRCNLDCVHCNKKINGMEDTEVVDIPIELVDSVISQAEPFKTRVVALTGGEPTTHKNFRELCRCVNSHDVDWTIMTNGQNFREIYPVLLENHTHLKGITLSIEGASPETNDPIRGSGTFDKVMDAMKLCRRHGISFGTQVCVSTRNVQEIDQIAAMCDAAGSDELSFVLLRPSRRNVEEGLLLTFEDAEEAENRVAALKDQFQRLKVSMTTGYYSPQPLFVCRPLSLSMISVDYNGYLRVCPDVTNYRDAGCDTTDIVADLNVRPLQFALKDLVNRIAVYWANKIDWVCMRDMMATDYYPCYYCLRYFNKSDCLDL